MDIPVTVHTKSTSSNLNLKNLKKKIDVCGKREHEKVQISWKPRSETDENLDFWGKWYMHMGVFLTLILFKVISASFATLAFFCLEFRFSKGCFFLHI